MEGSAMNELITERDWNNIIMWTIIEFQPAVSPTLAAQAELNEMNKLFIIWYFKTVFFNVNQMVYNFKQLKKL